jgi:chromosome segregation ATPase
MKNIQEAEEAPEIRAISVVVQNVITIISSNLKKFDEEMDRLNKRLSVKMTEFTTKEESLNQQFETLSNDFGQKSSEVLALGEKIKSLENVGRASDQEAIQRLIASSNELLDKLQKSKEEAAKAAKMTTANRQEMNKRIAELQDWGSQASQEIEELKKMYLELHAKYRRELKMQVQPGISAAAAAAKKMKPVAEPTEEVNHYGEFNLKEHLERAMKKQGGRQNWF